MKTFRTTMFAVTALALASFASAQSFSRGYSLGNSNIRGRAWMRTAVTANYGSTVDTRTYVRVGTLEQRLIRVDGLFRASRFTRRIRVRGEFAGNLVYEHDNASATSVPGNHTIYNALTRSRNYVVDGMTIRVVTRFRADGSWHFGVGLNSRFARTDVQGWINTTGRGHSAYATNLTLGGWSAGLESNITLPTNRMVVDLHTTAANSSGTVKIYEYAISVIQKIAKAWGWYTVVNARRDYRYINRTL